MAEKKTSSKKVVSKKSTKNLKRKPENKEKVSKKNVNKEDKLIVSKKEVEEDMKKNKRKNEDYEDVSPNWYHYVIVLLVIFGGFYLIYIGFEFFNEDEPQTVIKTQTYKYEHVVGNITYNIYFHSPVEKIKNLNYPIQVDKYDLFRSDDFRFSFKEYNGTDNGEVVRASTKLLSFLKQVYLFKFDANKAFVYYNETNCSDSSEDHVVVVFDPYQNKTGVFKDENSCVQIYADDPLKMVLVADKFIYSLSQDG